jgi:hypothetical protein
MHGHHGLDLPDQELRQQAALANHVALAAFCRQPRFVPRRTDSMHLQLL